MLDRESRLLDVQEVGSAYHAVDVNREGVCCQLGMQTSTQPIEGISMGDFDIELLAQDCRFRDCSHEAEPGCAVQSAIANQQLDAERLESFLKLRRELGYLERKQDVLSRIEQNRKWKRIHKAVRRMYRNRDKP